MYESQQGNANPPSSVAHEIARKIVEINKVPALCLVIFCKKEMGTLKYSFGANAYELKAAAGDFQGTNFSMKTDDEVCKNCVKSGIGNTVVDFDDHFEDAKQDWRNLNFTLS